MSTPTTGNDNTAAKLKLAVGAIGIVFGDIGTSPIYAFRETFASHHGAPGIEADPVHIHGVLSLVFWSMMMVVTFKYVLTIMKADNRGEGGSLALLALLNRKTDNARLTAVLVLLGVFATSLFYGDSMITPAISVLSATEGLQYIVPGFDPYIVPTAVAILFGLFAIQARGTDKVGKLFGPVIVLWFAVLAGTGAVLREQAQAIRESIARDGFYLRVPVGKPFYLYLTQTLDRSQARSSPVLTHTAAPTRP